MKLARTRPLGSAEPAAPLPLILAPAPPVELAAPLAVPPWDEGKAAAGNADVREDAARL